MHPKIAIRTLCLRTLAIAVKNQCSVINEISIMKYIKLCSYNFVDIIFSHTYINYIILYIKKR